MSLFSERYKYVNVSDMFVRETITPEIQNAICSCYDRLRMYFYNSGYPAEGYYANLEKYLWVYFLNQREACFQDGIKYNGGIKYKIVATSFLEDDKNPWYRKLDLLKCTTKLLKSKTPSAYKEFVGDLNFQFERLNFAYRVVDAKIVEIVSKEELKAIETSMQDSPSNIRMHLGRALELYAERPNGDYRNSIKESITAVEAYCRELTGKSTLGTAISEMEDRGLNIPKVLTAAFEKLYAYTNHPETGIRHALMDEDGRYVPASEEAMFMLVSCSSFINYLNKKLNINQCL